MGRKYLILGASSDLGMNFIENNNWKKDDEIILHYHSSKDKLEEIISKINGHFLFLKADFCDKNSVEIFIKKIKEYDFVPSHILHAPSLVVENKRFTEYQWNDFEKQINVQCRSLFMVLKSILPAMAKQKYGKIVVILTAYVLNIPPKFISAYCTSKYALMGLSKSIAVEYAGKNIQINMISPSMMETKFLDNMYEQIITQSAMNNPMKRNAKVQDITPMIKYLFSDECSFMTGTNIPITGGSIF